MDIKASGAGGWEQADALTDRVFLPSAWSTRYAYFCLMSSTDLRYSSGFGLLRSQRAHSANAVPTVPGHAAAAACACGQPTAAEAAVRCGAVQCGAVRCGAVQCIVSLWTKRLQGVAARCRSFRELEFGTRVPELLADERSQLQLQKAKQASTSLDRSPGYSTQALRVVHAVARKPLAH